MTKRMWDKELTEFEKEFYERFGHLMLRNGEKPLEAAMRLLLEYRRLIQKSGPLYWACSGDFESAYEWEKEVTRYL